MFSRQPRPPAIATQLVLFFILAAALLLSCALGIFYWIVVRHAAAEDRAVLLDKLSAVAAQLERAADVSALASQIQSGPVGEKSVSWLRIIAPDGTVVAESRGMRRLLPPPLFPPPSTPNSPGSAIRDYRQGDHLFALSATTASVQNHAFTIQVAQDRTEDEQFRREFQLLVAIVLAAAIVAAAIIATTATKRGLRPLAEMTRRLERVGPARFNERIEPSRWPRELQPVAAAFDDMLARLDDSFRRLSQFSADLAHELRTPVGNILGEAQVTLSRPRSPEEYRVAIESTASECERLSAIVDNLLFLARAEAADRQIDRTEFDARAAAEKIATYYQTVAEDRGVRIVCRGETEVFADPLLFSRALSNVVDNALRFTPNGGEIEVTCSGGDGQTQVCVRDTGAGIDPHHLPRVFDRFYRGDASRTSIGTGLGLALVKSIVELHGGSAQIESESGSGTIVRLFFPAAPTPS